MGNNKKYLCPMCGKSLTHDEVHQHVQHTCPNLKKR
jgi:predicted RNA-binding Zn-ribbon protein involved in translation (DUF1610 family)